MRDRTRWVTDILWRAALPVGLVFVWYYFTEVRPVFHRVMLPSPLAVLRFFQTALANGELLRHATASLTRIFQANLLAIGLGVPLGLAIGLYRPVELLLDGLVSIFKPIPPLAWVPLAILWLGIGGASVVFITFLAAFFAIMINTIAGARSIDRIHLRAALSLGAGPRRVMTNVVLPSVIPHIFTGLRIAIAPGVLDVAGVRLDQDPANSGLSLDVASGLVRLAMTEGIGVSGTSPLRARAATFTAVSATGDVAVDFTHAVAVTAEGVTLQGGSGSIDLNVLSGNLTTSGIIVHDGSGDVNLSASAAGGQIRAIATHQPGAMIRVADGNLDLRADSGVVVTDAARLLVDSPRFTGGTRTGNLRVGFTGGVEVGSVSILEGNGLLELLVHSGNFTTAANAVIANLSTGNLVVNVLQGGLTMHAGSEFRVANGLLDLRARDTLLLARLFSLGSDTYLQSFEGSVLGLDGISVHLITPGGFHVPQIFAASGQQIQLVVDADELDVNGTFRLSRGIEDFIFLQEMIP